MKDEALKLALEALDNLLYWDNGKSDYDQAREAITAINQALAAPVQEPVLQEIEQYRMQMAGISTAALGYWKEGDSIHPDYDTPALRDVAKLYAKYAALHAAAQPAVPDAIHHTDLSEHPQYIEGWNDCRQAMMEMMK